MTSGPWILAQARPAPGGLEYALLVVGALVMAIPAGLTIGTLVYLVAAKVRGRARDPEDEGLPMWGIKLWRRSVQLTTLVAFLSLIALALISFYVVNR